MDQPSASDTRKPSWQLRLLIGVLILAAAVWFTTSFLTQPEPDPEFGWNASASDVGVDSSGLRIAYRYTLDLNSYNPLYVSTPAGCTVLGAATSTNVDTDVEEKAYTERYLQQIPGAESVEEVMLIHNNNPSVPFLRTRYTTEDNMFVASYARLFRTSQVLITATLTCETEQLRTENEQAVEDGFRILVGNSTI